MDRFQGGKREGAAVTIAPPAPAPLRPAVKRRKAVSSEQSSSRRIALGRGDGGYFDPSNAPMPSAERADCGDEMRTPKNAQELGEMIATWLCIPSLKVSVYPDQFGGWEPRVIAAPAVATKYQPLAEEVATDLSRVYELSASTQCEGPAALSSWPPS
jgi:hypothetical protein